MKKIILSLLVLLCFSCAKDEPFSLVGKTYSVKKNYSSDRFYYVNIQFKTENTAEITFHEDSPIGAITPVLTNTVTYELSYPNITFSNGMTGKFISQSEFMSSSSTNHYYLQP